MIVPTSGASVGFKFSIIEQSIRDADKNGSRTSECHDFTETGIIEQYRLLTLLFVQACDEPQNCKCVEK